MLELRPANLEDWEEEYRANSLFPADENGFKNKEFGVSAEEFRGRVLPGWIANSRGEDLPTEGTMNTVPNTTYFLWDDNEIVGKFKLRHHLNEQLKVRGGHIGFAILPQCRRKGYAKRGLALLIEEAKKIIPEDYILMSVLKKNEASRRTQEANGAYVWKDMGEYYLMRIDLK